MMEKIPYAALTMLVYEEVLEVLLYLLHGVFAGIYNLFPFLLLSMFNYFLYLTYRKTIFVCALYALFVVLADLLAVESLLELLDD